MWLGNANAPMTNRGNVRHGNAANSILAGRMGIDRRSHLSLRTWLAEISGNAGKVVFAWNPAGIVSRATQLIYFPVPKAACTSIKLMIAQWEGLEVGAEVHNVAFETVRAAAVHRLPGFRSFTVVRNPWDRLWSCYKDKIVGAADRFGRVHPGFERYNRILRRPVFFVDMTFDAFVRVVAQIPDFLADEHFRSQIEMASGPFGRFVVDRWFDLERLEDLDDLVPPSIPRPLDLPKVNQTTALDYRDAYTAELRATVEIRYARDVKIFGYHF